MEMWFSDIHTDGVKLSIRIEEQLFSSQSEVQRIDVLESKDFGKILVVDGDLMLTERDEFIYHEMITHVPMAVHPDVKQVLVVGGGDGGVVRELIKYDTIEQIDVVEPDPLLVEVCRKYIPEIANSLTDSRFYGNCYNALHEDGIMINQNESPFYTEEAFQCQRMHRRILETFPICRVYQAHIPSYPSGHWLFGFASKKYHPLDDLDKVGWKLKGIHTKYYEPRLHAGVFALPVYVEELLEDVEKKDGR